jgi:hypothetical protein
MMSWFKSAKDKLESDHPEAILEMEVDLPSEQRREIRLDEDYVRVRLNTMRIAHGRVGTQKYYGCVYAEFRASDERIGEAVYHKVTTPDYLKDLDETNLGRVLVKDILLLDSVPYRGSLEVQLGLVSVPSKGGDLVAPYLEFLNDVAEKTGFGAIAKTALGYVQPLQRGFDLLCGASKQTRLEVGLEKGFNTLKTGRYVLCRHNFQRQISVNTENYLVDADGAEIQSVPYIIYSIEATDRNDRYAQIPEIKEAHEYLMRLFKDRDDKKIREEGLPHFRAVCGTCPDLTLRDAMRLADKEKARYETIFGGRTMVSGAPSAPLWSLEDLNLYDGKETPIG